MKRTAEIKRKTKETDISLSLNLDGSGKADLDCPIGFLNHMLSAFAKHGLFDITLKARGDLEVDQHHLVEDVGIVLGMAFAKVLGEKRGIQRVADALVPMDETLAQAVVDIGGRPYLYFSAPISGIPLVSGTQSFQTDTIEDFWLAFTINAGLNLHLEVFRGRSDHHIIEALFKAASRALSKAVAIDSRAPTAIPSTKGVIA